jgi:hypothetical protein
VRRVDVVVDRVDLVAVGLHRIGRGALLGEVDHRVGAMLLQPLLEALVFLGDVEEVEAERPAGHLLPDAAALLDRVHGGERLHAQLRVDPAARQVVHDVDLVAAFDRCRQVGQPTKPSPPRIAIFIPELRLSPGPKPDSDGLPDQRSEVHRGADHGAGELRPGTRP